MVRKEMSRPREMLEPNNNSEPSFIDNEAQNALLRNASIDSTLDVRNKGK